MGLVPIATSSIWGFGVWRQMQRAKWERHRVSNTVTSTAMDSRRRSSSRERGKRKAQHCMGHTEVCCSLHAYVPWGPAASSAGPAGPSPLPTPPPLSAPCALLQSLSGPALFHEGR
eukprot:365782-Chlamydomonas_euryale.AAC.8